MGMKRKLLAWLTALMLMLTPVLALADGDETEPPETPEPVVTEEPTATPDPTATPSPEPTAAPTAAPTETPTETPELSSDPLKIDTFWKYPGMDKSYAGGYLPKESNTDVRFIVPLVGEAQGDVIRVVPEFPSGGPFAPNNLQFDVRKKTYDVTQGKDKTGKATAYLIDFTAPLKNPHYKGTYTVTLRVSYQSPAGDPVELSFPIQVSIKKGKTQSTGGGGGGGSTEPEPVKKPLLRIEKGTVSPEETTGGDNASLSVRFANAGDLDACNIRISASPADSDLILTSDLNGSFYPTLAVGESVTTKFDFRVARHALEGDHLIEVGISYEDKYGNSYSESGAYRIHAAQQVELAYDPIKLPESLTSGDTFMQIIYVYNPSCATAYNVRGVLNVNGLICSSAYLGNIEPQGSATKELSVFVTTLPGSAKYGETWGSFELRYEDEAGEEQFAYQDLKSSIMEPVKVTDEEKEKQEQEQKEQQTLSQWWISLLVAIAVIVILIAIILITRFVRLMRMK